jgi:hypothetical protein
MPILAAAGTSLIGGLIGSSSARKAAEQQRIAGEAAQKKVDYATGAAVERGYAGIEQANNAVDAGTGAATKYIGDAGTAQKGVYADMKAGLTPYAESGTYGLDKMKSQGDFSFNPKDLESEPGYQFQLAQGLKALQSSAASRGMLQSGATLKAMEGYSQGLAGTSYKDAYARALSTFDTNRAGYQSLANMGQTANAQNLQAGGIYGGELTSLAGMGVNTNMQAAGLKTNTAMQGNEYIGNAQMQGAGKDADLITGVGNSQAAGTVGAANAWGGALNGVGNSAMLYGLSKMGRTKPGGSGGGWSNPAFQSFGDPES